MMVDVFIGDIKRKLAYTKDNKLWGKMKGFKTNAFSSKSLTDPPSSYIVKNIVADRGQNRNNGGDNQVNRVRNTLKKELNNIPGLYTLLNIVSTRLYKKDFIELLLSDQEKAKHVLEFIYGSSEAAHFLVRYLTESVLIKTVDKNDK